MRPIILIELNEVPNEILDDYATRSSFMASFLEGSARYTTVADDRIQLDPWIAWPSLHRGVRDELHGLLHLGQDTAKAAGYPPIWRLLADGGHSVGVYGSLFSSAESNFADYRFFVPDVFSPHSKVKPTDLENFQNFNLAMTRASARNVNENVSAGAASAVLALARRRRLRPSTVGRISTQLISERVNRQRISRRRNIQTDLHADAFVSLLRPRLPSFSTFYTNNVAAAMHRFWSASQSEFSRNKGVLSKTWMETYGGEIDSALRSVERLLQVLVKRCPSATIVVASAIGQEEIPAENHKSFLTITDPGKFIASMVGTANVVQTPTMVPDFTFQFDAATDATRAMERIATIEIDGLRPVQTPTRMHSREIEATASGVKYLKHDYGQPDFKHPFTYSSSDDRTVHVSLQVDDHSGPGAVNLNGRHSETASLGIGQVNHTEGVNCTAQHSAFGSLVVNRGKSAPTTDAAQRDPKSVVSTMDIAPSILQHFGIPIPSYMTGSPIINFQ